MSARHVFFGALGFASAEHFQDGSARVLEGVDPVVAKLLRECLRGDRVMVCEIEAFMPASLWGPLVGSLHELAAIATAGHVVMVYDGDDHEFEVATASGRARVELPLTQPSRWLPLRDRRPARVEVARHGKTMTLEFEVVTRHDGSSAFDMRDWLGLSGRLLGDGERLYYELEPANPNAPGELFLWAEPARRGSTALVAHPNSELITWIEVAGPESVEVSGVRHAEAVKLIVHALDARMEDAPYFGKEWRTLASSRSVWVVPEVGLVAIRA